MQDNSVAIPETPNDVRNHLAAKRLLYVGEAGNNDYERTWPLPKCFQGYVPNIFIETISQNHLNF